MTYVPPPPVEIPPVRLYLRDRYRGTREGHRQAQGVVRELGYPVGSQKWEAFWAGFVCWCRSGTPGDCPIEDITPAQRRRGRRTSQVRVAWMKGFEAAEGGR